MKLSGAPGVRIPVILLPAKGTDLEKWAVIACDQFTSQPEYWQRVKDFVGESPSTYNLILPEVFLGTPQEAFHIQKVKQAMHTMLDSGMLVAHQGPVYVERTSDHRVRRGLMLSLDLDEYDYRQGSQSLIRSTEGTILERLPPRIRIREGALLELPHIIVLIDDPGRTVIEPLSAMKTRMPELYNFDLMAGSGHLAGYSAADPALEEAILKALANLADPDAFQSRYGVGADKKVLLFAIGDGNHSLATAKAIWERLKPQVSPDHPARFALVEIENLHDEGLEFKPIHRVLFKVSQDGFVAMNNFFGEGFKRLGCHGQAEMIETVENVKPGYHRFGIISSDGYCVVEVADPKFNLPVATLQAFLDEFVARGGAGKIDYVHGEDVVDQLGRQAGNLGFYLPAIQKSDLFKTVILDGTLPRKTFSMGEAREKRFYMECRRIA